MVDVRDGHLCVAGRRVVDIVDAHGEPAYIYDAETIDRQYAQLRTALPDDVQIFYSVKANPNAGILSHMAALGDGAEVSSGGELRKALEAGFAPQDIIFVGPGKSEAEILAAVREGIYAIVAESVPEIRLIDDVAADVGRRAPVALRINPERPMRGARLTMAGKPSQFGIDEADIGSAFEEASSCQHVEIMGIHAYLGTRILDAEVVAQNTRYIAEMASRASQAYGFELAMVDFGGGFGVPYFENEEEFDIDALQRELAGLADECLGDAAHRARLMVESGRYLVADCGMYVARVRYVKQSQGKSFVILSGGTNHHLAAAAIGGFVRRNFPVAVANRMDEPNTLTADLCGPLCTPTDILARNVEIPTVEPGDLVAVLKSGAYGFSASPLEFLSHERPREVLLRNGQSQSV